MESRTLGRPVTIRLHSSIQHTGQDPEMHEMNVTGQYIERAGVPYLKYEEEQNGQKIRTTVKMDAEDALILRGGAVSMRLPFSVDDKRSGEYGNGQASFKLAVKTNNLTFDKEQNGGRFAVDYELHAQGSNLGVYKLAITYVEGKS